MKQTTGIILGTILILALLLLGYAFSQQSVIIAKHEATPPAAASNASSLGVTISASSSL